MLRISIDGACRRNGKPDCIAAGGVFIKHFDRDFNVIKTECRSNYEINSTNQRGELLALLTALDYVWSSKLETQIITDSEYLFNAMTKDWLDTWSKKGWVTSINEPVKNKDILLEIKQVSDKCKNAEIDVTFYHIKGHVIPFGKVTAQQLLNRDQSGREIMLAIFDKYNHVREEKKDKLDEARELSEKNNGFLLDDDMLREFVVTNLVADAIATKCVEAADTLYKSQRRATGDDNAVATGSAIAPAS